MKLKYAFLFLLLFSVVFATLTLGTHFINHDSDDTMGPMYECYQQDSTYFIRQDVRYHLDTQLSLTDPHDWLGGSGSYDNIHSGDSVCEGNFNYVVGVNAVVPLNAFNGKMDSHSGPNNGPDKWPTCGKAPYTSCPTPGNIPGIWSNSYYSTYSCYSDAWANSMELGSNYGWRSISYRESGTGNWSSGQAAEVATVFKGTSSLKQGSNLIDQFNPLSGTAPSHTGTFGLATSSYTQYTLTQRLDVSGGMMGTYNPNPGVHREYYEAFTTTGTSGQAPYAVSNIHDTGVLNVYDTANVGVVAPSILSVDLGSDGFQTGPYVTKPGADVPVTITLLIPARPSNFYPLDFEFYGLAVSSPFTFKLTSSMPEDCGDCGFGVGGTGCGQINGGWYFPSGQYTKTVTGTIHVPADISSGTHQISVSVNWRTCSGQLDCNGNGKTGTTAPMLVNVDIPNNDLPDFTCTVEPVSIIGASQTATSLDPGQGVNQWRITVSNIGKGDLTYSTNASEAQWQWFCLYGYFNAYSQNYTPVITTYTVYPSIGTPLWLPTSDPYLNSGDSVSAVVNGQVRCSNEGEIGAYIDFNSQRWAQLSQCLSHFTEEEDYDNNYCEWSIPCNKPVILDNNCTLAPAVQNGGVGTTHQFALTCDNGQHCDGVVSWALTSGQNSGNITGSSSSGATVHTNNNLNIGTAADIILQATVTGPSNQVVCKGLIIFNPNSYCELTPTPQQGAPGSNHTFNIQCGIEPHTQNCDGPVIWNSQGPGTITQANNLNAHVHAYDTLDPATADDIIVHAHIDNRIGSDADCNGTIFFNATNEGDSHCTITPATEQGEPGSNHTFTLKCGIAPNLYDCPGAVSWGIGQGPGDITSSNSVSANVHADDGLDPAAAQDIIVDAHVDNALGADADCNATIYFNGTSGQPEGLGCYVDVEPPTGSPGSHHVVTLYCAGTQDCNDVDEFSGVTWAIDGSNYVEYWSGGNDEGGWLDLTQNAVNATVAIKARVQYSTDEGTAYSDCSATITTPGNACYVFI